MRTLHLKTERFIWKIATVREHYVTVFEFLEMVLHKLCPKWFLPFIFIMFSDALMIGFWHTKLLNHALSHCINECTWSIWSTLQNLHYYPMFFDPIHLFLLDWRKAKRHFLNSSPHKTKNCPPDTSLEILESSLISNVFWWFYFYPRNFPIIFRKKITIV